MAFDKDEEIIVEGGTGSPILKLLAWDRFDPSVLAESEATLLRRVKCDFFTRFVDITICQMPCKIYTLTATTPSTPYSNIPFVLVHGFGAGVAVWSSNIDALSAVRPTYAIDLPGFGRSSRPKFSEDATLAEIEYVDALEHWREAMHIKQMIMIGHSFGGYLSSAYALRYPERVRHLVLVDPWGFNNQQSTANRKYKIPPWIRAIGASISYFNALTALRVSGPIGCVVVRHIRSQIGGKHLVGKELDALVEYFYQCNAREPTGEVAFRAMGDHFVWSKRPMVNRFQDLAKEVPTTFLYGKQSWIGSGSAYKIQKYRKSSYVDIIIVPNSGHVIYGDAPDTFNKTLANISATVDSGDDRKLHPVQTQKDENCN